MSGEVVNNFDKLKVSNSEDDVVDPWNVVSKSETGIDYDKLIRTCVFMFVKYVFTLLLQF